MKRVALISALVLGCSADDPLEADGIGDAGAAADPPREPAGPVTLALAGDAMLARGIQRVIEDDPEHVLFRDLAEPLVDVDMLAFNLETTITEHDVEWPDKNFHFKVDPPMAAAVIAPISRDTGVSRVIASNANNHALDYGIPGLVDTLEHLDAVGLPRVGAGLNAATARAPVVLTTDDGVRVAFFAASSTCSCGPAEQWSAGPESPGAWMLYDDASWQQAADAVTATADDVDWVVFSIHWGGNYHETWPAEELRVRGEQLTVAGADVVFGHSSHHVLPTERFDDGLVLYGTGDFVDDYSPVPPYRNDLSYIGHVVLSPGAQPDLTVIPIRLEHDGPHHVQALPASDPDHAFVIAAAAGA